MIASLVLSAGRGERLRPLTDWIPKPALPVLDVPLVVYALERVAPLGPAVVNVAHLGDVIGRMLVTELGTGAPELLHEGATGIGTARTLYAVRERVGDDLLIWNADALTDVDPDELRAAHSNRGRALTLAVRPVDRGADLVTEAGRVHFVDRRTNGELGGYQYIGVSVANRSAIDMLGRDAPAGLAEALFRPLADGGQIELFVHEGYALDVGTPKRYLRANLDVLNGVAPAPRRRLQGRVFDLDHGRAYVGPRASVADGAVATGAVVMRAAAVAERALIRNAVVWPEERVPASTRVVDAIFACDQLLRG